MCDKNTEPALTDYDITMNSLHQDNMFKGTIVVCIIYAVFAFVLIAAAYFVDNIRDLLFDKFLPFTLIYIVGTILIIMIFIYNILSFKPKKIEKKKVDENISCPDYWKLQVLDDTVINNSFDTANYNKNLFKYRCIMDEKVFNKVNIYTQNKDPNWSNVYRLGNIPGYVTDIGENGTFTDIYNTSASGQINKFNLLKNDEDIVKNDKFLYLYKNINGYNNVNLNYTNNKSINSNIISDLRESALVMNNYKINLNEDKSKIKSFIDITSNLKAGESQKPKYYHNSPNIITWSTPKSIPLNEGSTIPVTAPSGVSLARYTSTVYDWSTIRKAYIINSFGTKNPIHVYIIDTSKSSGINYVLVGYLKFEIEKKNNIYYEEEETNTVIQKKNNLYFEAENNIVIPAGLFSSKLNNNNHYFDTTYLYETQQTAATPLTNLNNVMKGPKVRLFNISKRPVEFDDSSDNIDKINFKTTNIPLTCSAVYPLLLASKEDNYTENNTLRCAYSKICNIPWSDMHCNEIIG